MKITAEDLLAFGICDQIIPESEGGAQNDIKETAANIAAYLHGAAERLAAQDPQTLPESRYAKFRRIGRFTE
jgi:acetyl-CoA carboxylase carboxyl transferase subunit alpha